MPPAIGAVAGFAMSVWAERLRSTSEEQLLILAAQSSDGAVRSINRRCDALNVYRGAVLANASTRDRELLASIRQLDIPHARFSLLLVPPTYRNAAPDRPRGAAYVLPGTAKGNRGMSVRCVMGGLW